MYRRERQILCSLLFLGFLAGGSAKLQHILISPVALNAGQSGKACVNIVGNEENLAVELVLQHEGKNTTIIDESVSASKYFQCADYQVPDLPNASPVTLMLSAEGQKTNILERKTVVIKPTNNNCIFQMDKPIYKPGQKVLCRLVCMNSELKPVKMKFPMIYLLDPSRARLKQWQGQETEHGIVSMEFHLIKDAPLGTYTFIAERESTYSLSQGIRVEEYVPPRFSLTVDAPNTISVLERNLNFTTTATYTYGEPVTGAITVRICKEPHLYRNCLRDKGDICSNIIGELDQDGSFKGSVDMSEQSMGLGGMSLRMEITVTEEGTGIQAKESTYTWVTTQAASLNFDYDAMNRYYKRGIPYSVVGQLTEQNNPMPNEKVEIELDDNLIETVTTDSEGRIDYGIDTTDMLSPNFTVRISYRNPDQCYYPEWRDRDYPSAEYTAYRFYSKTGSFLQAKYTSGKLKSGQSQNVEIQYAISQSGIEKGSPSIPIYYMVLSQSKIVYSGQQDVDLTNSMNGSVNIALPVSAEMSPSSNLLIYTLLGGETIVDTVSLKVESSFNNNVDMAFSEEKGMPGSTVEAVISGDPESICGLKVIDYSLVLLNRYERFSPEGVRGLFYYWPSGYNVAGLNVEDPEPQCIDPNKLAFFSGNYYNPVYSKSEGDSYQKLMDVAVIFGTNTQLRKPKVCGNEPPEQFGAPIAMKGERFSLADASAGRLSGFGGGSGGGGASTIETIRSNFAEVFMWHILPLNKEGHASISEVAPDTITSWQGTVFCMSDKGGFGMNKYPANYTTIQPFFIELTKPYSIIRGETLLLKGVVHNYLDKCIKVQVNLEASDAFNAEQVEGKQDACVCSNGKSSYSWEIQANVLGEINFTVTAQTTFIGQSCEGPNDDTQSPRKDTVKQSILAEAEGVEQELTLSNFVFVQPGKKVTVPVSITPPDNVVQDSFSAYVAAVGDVFGLPLKNLLDLVKQPYGCAEQNLAVVSSIISVLDYLNNTGQLSEETLQMGKQYILEGYYRHLGFASGNAFKVFRSSSKPNLWLTINSFSTFERAKKYIQIDDTRQQQILVWLENQQKLEDGCYEVEENPFTVQGTNSNIQLTAYLAFSLMDSEYDIAKTLVAGAMECLKTASTKQQNITDEILMLHAFTRANMLEHSEPLMERLLQKSKVKGGTIHWEPEDMPPLRAVPFFNPQFSPPAIELTSYMLLNTLKRAENLKKTAPGPGDTNSALPEKDMEIMAQCSLWLIHQQNPYGGMSSTSDTNIALQALGAFAKLLYTPNSQQTIKIVRNNENIGELNLDRENRLLVQSLPLPDASGDYSFEIEGNGYGLIQANVKYNIPIPKENSVYSLALSATSDKCLNEVASIFNLTVTVSYHGCQNASSMTIVKIRMLSGFHPHYWSLRELEDNKIISKYEETPKGELLIYLNSVSQEPMTFSFRAVMGERVLNVKESSGNVYNYYNKGNPQQESWFGLYLTNWIFF